MGHIHKIPKKSGLLNFVFVCPSTCLHATHRPPLDEFSGYLIFDVFFFKYVEKIDVLLKSDKNDRYFAWRCMYIYGNMLLNSSWNERCSDKSCRANQSTHSVSNNFFFSEKHDLYECGKVWYSQCRKYVFCMLGNEGKNTDTHS